MVHLRLAAGAGCHTGGGSSTPIDDLCNRIRDNTHQELLVVLVGRIIWPLVLVVGLLLAARIVQRVADRALHRAQADSQVCTLVHNVLVLAGWVVAVGGFLVGVGLDLSIFLTLGGISTVVLGLAFQDLLRNVVAGAFLLVERPFRIGDVISIDDVTGAVVTVELRTTALRLADGRLAVVPNLDAFTKRIINLTAFDRRRFDVAVWVPEGADVPTLVAAMVAEMRSLPEIVDEPAPRVQPEVTVDGGVTLTAQYWLAWRDCDPDAVSARLVTRLAAASAAVRAGRTPDAAPERPAPPAPAEPEAHPGGEGRRFPISLPPMLRRRDNGD